MENPKERCPHLSGLGNPGLLSLYPPKGEEPVWPGPQPQPRKEKPGPASRDTEVLPPPEFLLSFRRPSIYPSPLLQVHFASPSPSLALSPLVLLSRSPPGSSCPAPLPTDRRPPHEGQGIRRRRGNHRGPHIHLSPFILHSDRFLKT